MLLSTTIQNGKIFTILFLGDDQINVVDFLRSETNCRIFYDATKRFFKSRLLGGGCTGNSQTLLNIDMEYYFFLQGPGDLRAEITLANFPPTRISQPLSIRYICAAIAEDGYWNVTTLGMLQPSHTCTVSAVTPGLEHHDLSRTLMFLSSRKLEGQMEALPQGDDFDSWPNWRANLRIRAKTTSVSYQGEYPGNMLDIRNGTLVSISSMIQSVPGFRNKVFLVSFSRKLQSAQAEVVFRRVKDGRVLKTFTVDHNRVNCMDLSGMDLADEPELILMASVGIAGIPVYLTHDDACHYLSLEHTHPPAELTVFGASASRFGAVKNMKKFWLNYSHDTQ